MTPTEFHALVARMREAQRSYFKTRSKTALTEARRLAALARAAGAVPGTGPACVARRGGGRLDRGWTGRR